MKVLRLSDEDYQALLNTLDAAADIAHNYEYSATEKEAERLLDLIKPMEYLQEFVPPEHPTEYLHGITLKED
jgi:hypothetical protein